MVEVLFLVFVSSRQTPHTSFYPGPRGQRYDQALEAEDRGASCSEEAL